MHRSRLRHVAAIVGLMAARGSAAAQDNFVQSPTQFRAAIGNRSTSPSFVLVTVVDGRSGTKRTGCTEAGFLLSAIATDKGFERSDYHGRMAPDASARATAEALASKSHVYTFYKTKALAAIPTNARGSDLACKLIRSGVPAYMQDRSGQIMAGQP